jgi:hypothetical protein
MGIGAAFKSLTVEGKPAGIKKVEINQSVLAAAEIPVIEGDMHIELGFIPTVEILPVVTRTGVGDSNKGLKIIAVKKGGAQLTIQVEGLTGNRYALGITNPGLISNVEGATLEKDRLIIAFPDGKPGQFIFRNIVVYLR